MKSKTLLAGVVILVVLLAGVIAAAAQGPRPLHALLATSDAGTGFTYQEQLKSSGAPVNLTCDFIFKLYDDPSAGAQVGSNVAAPITVTNGLFTTVLDFGTGAITGDARWLDMQVGCPTGASPIALTPRQALTPAPMALALPGLWTQQNGTSPNLIGGFSGNVISPSVVGATIGGGGESGRINRIAFPGDYATIGGGHRNTASGYATTVGGGDRNTASGNSATVGGGIRNTASGIGATVPGGYLNTASGDYSFAAGRYANTNGMFGTFIWGDDSVTTEISATASNQFLIRAAGGMGINTNAPLANTLTVNGQIIAGGTSNPPGNEPLDAQGNLAGLRLADRAGGGNADWVLYANGGLFRISNDSTFDRVTVDLSGNVTTTGKLTANGGFNGRCLPNFGGPFKYSTANACNMDVAEAFASVDRTEPGDVVALLTQPTGGMSPAAGPTVRKASRADGGLVVGVVSTNPGLVFDNGQTHLAGDNSQLITADRTVVALVGRVPVKASLENGPIAVGDPLTGASAAGFAMKATQAGQIIGYALQSSDELSEGKLLAWLQPGLYVPPAQVAWLNASTTEADSAALVADSPSAALPRAQLEAASRLATQVAQMHTRNAALELQNTSLEARVTALEQSRPADSSIPTTWLLFGGMIVLGVAALRRRA